MEIGGAGTGTFTLSAGAYASLGLGSTVTVGGRGAAGGITATGAGSLLSVAGDLQVGSYDGSSAGTAMVTQGATLAVAGDILDAQGTLTVVGTGSVLSARDDTALGAGAGLRVATGGVASFVDTTIAGSVVLQGGTLDTRNTLDNLATIAGTGLVGAGSLYNNGTITATAGTLQLAGPEAGVGSNVIGRSATLELDGSVAHTQKIAFSSGAVALALKDAAGMAGRIRGFGAGQKIDLLGDAATKASFAHDVLTISNGSTAVASLHFTGSYVAADFALASDGRGGTLVTYSAPDRPGAPHGMGVPALLHTA